MIRQELVPEPILFRRSTPSPLVVLAPVWLGIPLCAVLLIHHCDEAAQTAAEAARRVAARQDVIAQDRLFKTQLAALQRFDQIGADPIQGYQEAEKARRTFETNLHANPKYLPLSALAEKVTLHDRGTYARHIAETKLARANKAIKSGDFPGAYDILTEALSTLDKIPAQVSPLPWAAVRKRIERRRSQIARKALKASLYQNFCGPAPNVAALDGRIPGAADFLREIADDPDSIEVTDCTQPELSKKDCWVSYCKVRGRNAFGANVLNVVRFSIGSERVLSAQPVEP